MKVSHSTSFKPLSTSPITTLNANPIVVLALKGLKLIVTFSIEGVDSEWSGDNVQIDVKVW